MFTDTISEGAFKWCYQTLLINNNQLLNYHGMSMDNTEPYSLFDLTKKRSHQTILFISADYFGQLCVSFFLASNDTCR